MHRISAVNSEGQALIFVARSTKGKAKSIGQSSKPNNHVSLAVSVIGLCKEPSALEVHYNELYSPTALCSLILQMKRLRLENGAFSLHKLHSTLSKGLACSYITGRSETLTVIHCVDSFVSVRDRLAVRCTQCTFWQLLVKHIRRKSSSNLISL